jgi:purine nucleoside permease
VHLVLEKRPLLVLTLKVSAIFLYVINKTSPSRSALKDRMVQVSTGEGKSLTMAVVSAIATLTGNFVEVMSSSHYLAQRNKDTFRPFF